VRFDLVAVTAPYLTRLCRILRVVREGQQLTTTAYQETAAAHA